MDKKISEKQLIRLLTKGSTVNLKGFKTDTGTTEGVLKFDCNYAIVLEEKQLKTTNLSSCPKCKKGTILKGKTAYGCSNYATGCDFKYLFENVKIKAGDLQFTKELVYTILHGEH